MISYPRIFCLNGGICMNLQDWENCTQKKNG